MTMSSHLQRSSRTCNAGVDRKADADRHSQFSSAVATTGHKHRRGACCRLEVLTRLAGLWVLLALIPSYYFSLTLQQTSDKPTLRDPDFAATVRQLQQPARASKNRTGTVKNAPFHYHLHPDDQDGFSACLLISEDNHYLVEWLAYHYWFLPLRRLIVAVDPASRTSPGKILHRYRHLIDITMWNDTDVFGPQTKNGTHDVTVTTAIKEHFSFRALDQVVKIPVQNRLLRHRYRQSLVFSKCLAQFRNEHRTWVALLDTDEYITVHNGASDEYRIRQVWPTLYRMLESPENSNPMLNLQETSCINVRRDQMSTNVTVSSELPPVPKSRSSDSKLDWMWKTSNYNTLQFRHRAHYYQIYGPPSSTGVVNMTSSIVQQEDGVGEDEDLDVPQQENPTKKKKGATKRRSLAGKCIVHANRIAHDLRLRYDRVGPHRPTTDCPPGKTRLPPYKAPLIIHHYPGTWEQFSFRQSSDPRHGVRDRARYDEYSRLKHAQYTEDLSPEWVSKFVDVAGVELAQELLEGIGTVERRA